jgi:hypothetical protein
MVRSVILLVLLIGLLVCAGCGGSGGDSNASPQPPASQTTEPTQNLDDHPDPTLPSGAPDDAPTIVNNEVPGDVDPTAEDELARSMLLTLNDFPTGWVHKPDEAAQAPGPAPLEACLVDTYPGQTGSAIGGEFSDENTTRLSINPSVYVFQDASSASAAADTILAIGECFAEAIGDGLNVDETFAFGPSWTEPLSADSFGATAAVRFFNTQIYKREQLADSDVLVFDVVLIVDGRILYEVDGFQRHSPIDQQLLRHYVEAARAKIDASLGAAASLG